MERTLGCVVMAAGNARRFGENKLAAALDGQSLIRRALEAVPTGRFSRVVVVTQYPEIETLAEEFHFMSLCNAHPDWGISHTIHLGLAALGACDGALFQVSDQPLLRRESVDRLIDCWQAQPEKPARLSHNGIQGNPCIFPARLFPELMALTGDEGGSAVLRCHEPLLVEAEEGELTDVDTPQALAELRDEK